MGCADVESDLREPDVVLMVLDTFRADHIGSDGYERPLTPELEAGPKRGPRQAVPLSDEEAGALKALGQH